MKLSELIEPQNDLFCTVIVKNPTYEVILYSQTDLDKELDKVDFFNIDIRKYIDGEYFNIWDENHFSNAELAQLPDLSFLKAYIGRFTYFDVSLKKVFQLIELLFPEKVKNMSQVDNIANVKIKFPVEDIDARSK